MCPDIINRYLSNVLTLDQIETIRNKTIDANLNTLTNIPSSAIGKIDDKTKLNDDIVYKDVPNQTITQHTDINFQGLQDGDKFSWDAASGKWVNVQITEGGGTGDVIGGANVGEQGASVYYQENASHVLEFSKLKSNDAALSIANNGDLVEFDLADASTIQKGIVQLGTSGEADAAKAVIGTDSRLTNPRVPTAHASNHKSGQTDVIKLDELGAPTDITTLNATNSAHGLCPKLSGNASDVMKGDGTFGSMSASGTTYKVKNVTEVTFASTTALQTMVQYAFAANEMGTDKLFEVLVDGVYLNTSGSPKLQVKITFGTTVIFDKTIGTISSASAMRVFNLRFTFFCKGVQNAQRATGYCELSNESASGAGYGDTTQDEMVGSSPISGTSAEVTTVQKVLKVELAHDSSSSSISFTRTLSYIREV